jgi:PPM family protein phosphatase
VSEVRTTAEVLHGAARSDPGRVRANNEDLPLIDPARGIFGVIDGVGGEAGGEVAAATAHDVILQRLARPLGTPAERVREAIAIANNEIFRRSQESAGLRGMACVVTLAIVADGRVTVGHVGDTRLYKLRADGLRKLTRDHSPVGEREDAGELGEVDAMRHPRRNEVFRDVGSAYRDKDERDFVDVIEEPLERDSAILVCSDGLSDMLTSSTIAHIVRQHAGDPARVVEALVAAANDAGGKDNVTVVYAEGSQFPAAVGAGSTGTMTPTEPLASSNVRDPTERPPAADAPPSGVIRSILESRTAWFIAGTLVGVLGALALMLYVARTQVQAPQTRVVGAGGTAPFATIADAMNGARPGDVVRVEPGEYSEQVAVADGVDLTARLPGTVTISRPEWLDPSLPGLEAGGALGVRISGLRILAAPTVPADAAVSVGGSGVTLELVEIAGPFGRAITLLPESSVTVHGSRVAVTGSLIDVPDTSQATFTNSIFVRTGTAAQPPVTAGPLSRLTMSGNLFAGFEPEIVRGLAEARRRELLAGNIIVPPAAPPRRRAGERPR